MWIELSPLWVAVVNCVGIPAVHLLVSWVTTLLPAKIFEGPGMLGTWERGVYERVFKVRRWKDSLPDAGPWFGGAAKRQLESTDPDYLRRFAMEARRGEWAHYGQMVCLLVFVLWTPSPWWVVIVVYSVLSNLPCIVSLRYARLRVAGILGRS